MSIEPKIVTLAKNTGKALGLDPMLIYAVIQKESSGNPWAMRYEPDFLRRYVLPQGSKDQTENMARATSWGPMQVMGQVARELGLKAKYLSELCNEGTGVWYGAKHLSNKIKRYGYPAGISAYNHGEPVADDAYQRAVLEILAEVKEVWPKEE